ncbi:MAG TPA: reverse transcriptase domain-containing protein [Herpetosiphonaceae bacterium]|nr:reverse transcriptase domain-containing protein [Herpetosiphonaceae bacterium]
MLTESEQLITAIKLRELALQREQALATYARITALLAAEQDPRARIRLLHEHLRQLTFAKQPLHPSTTNMSILSDPATPASPELTDWWADQLGRELDSGRLRAELVSLFGALFQEWIEHPQAAFSNPEQTAALTEQVAAIQGVPAAATAHGAVLDQIFAAGFGAKARARLAEKITADPAEIDGDELRYILQRIAKDPFYAAATRAEARSLANDPIMRKELGDALTIMRDQPAAWRWPAAGVAAEARWARTRWRLFLQEDLLTACFHQVVASHWRDIFEEFCSEIETVPLKALKRIAKQGGADPALAAGVAAMYMASKSVDIWRPLARPAAADSAAQLERYGGTSSIFAARAGQIKKLRDWTRLGDYDGDYEHNLDVALQLINAEVRLGAQAFPDRPIYVLKTDFREYYASLNHEFVLDCLRRIGLQPEQIAFFAQYLAVPLHGAGHPGGSRRQGVGLPNHRPISDLLGELVLRLTEIWIERHAHVQIVRFVDDLTMIASDPGELERAWRALQDWCAACGLSLNMQKTGAIAIRGELPADLPQQPPRWLFVTIDSQGAWQLDQAAIGAFFAQTVSAMDRSEAILNKIEVYNGSCAYLSQAIGLRVDLGPAHREQVRDTLWRYGQRLTEQGSMVAHVRHLLGARMGSAVELPEGWFHWPITAGGLGVQQPLIIAHSYQDSWKKRAAPIAPAEREDWWQQVDSQWRPFYIHWLEPLEAGEPEANSVLTSLTDDFIARGGEVRTSEQHGLSGYWRWVLAIYGPQILERCGSFRFLFTELVPLQLIARKSTSKAQVPAE